jgi:anti-sigma regulatory factor (Ser/Thr protein kinase)
LHRPATAGEVLEQGLKMTPNEITSHGGATHQHTWQTLVEFDLSTQPEVERLAVGRVAEAMQRLNWPAAHLEQLKLAFAQAARNAMKCNCGYDPDAPLVIRVLIPENDPATWEADPVNSEPTQLQASEGEAQQAGQPPSRGWSFFLIEKVLRDSSGAGRHVLELFLYPGGK